MNESEIMARLAQCLETPAVKAALDRTADMILAELDGDPAQAKSTFRAISLDLYGELPADIRSAWMFALRRGFAHPPEYHPNSIQRMFAWRTSGEFEVWDGTKWVRHEIQPGDTGLSIPADTWHRAPALAADWVVASFHTAEANELIEIVGDPESGEVGPTRAYVE